MVKTLNILLIVIVLFTLISVTVYAGDPPSAPTNFRTTASGNNIVLSFIKGSGATNTVILRGDNRYPTSITDGTIVDNTTETSVTDTNQNSEIATKYYSAWSLDNSTGLYSLSYATVIGGATMLAFGVLVLLLIALTWLSITKVPICGLLTFALAIFTWSYINSNPLPNITSGSSTSTILMLVLCGWGAFIGLYGAGKILANDGRPLFDRAFHKDESQKVYQYDGYRQARRVDTSTMEGRALAYRMSIHGKLNQNRKKR